MPLPKSDKYTTDYIYSLPEGQRAELINGVVYDMVPPNYMHQKLLQRLCQKIANHIDSKKGNCEVLPAPFAVFLNEDDKTYVEPDISVICDKSKLTEAGCNGAPDFIIEVVSPSSRKMDYSTKMTLYSNAGVREYWIVDPRRKNITVNFFEENMLNIQYSFDSTIKVNIYNDLFINFSEIASILSIR